MPAPKQYSNYARYEKAEVYESQSAAWVVDFVSLGFVFGAFMLAMQIMLSYQNDVQATAPYIYQMMMMIGGLSIGTVVSKSRGGSGIKVGFPTQESMVKFAIYTITLFIATMVINGMIAGVFGGMSAIDYLVSQSAVGGIPITVFIAAVSEEVMYSLAFGILFFRVLSYGVTGFGGIGVVQQYIALFIAAIMNGLLFWFIHYYVYGTEMGIAVMLIVNRVIYTFLFYVTRDLKFPIALHVLHNMMVVL